VYINEYTSTNVYLRLRKLLNAFNDTRENVYKPTLSVKRSITHFFDCKIVKMVVYKTQITCILRTARPIKFTNYCFKNTGRDKGIVMICFV